MSTKDTDPAAKDAVNELSIAVERTPSKSRGTGVAPSPAAADSVDGQPDTRGSEPAATSVIGTHGEAVDDAADMPVGEQDSPEADGVSAAEREGALSRGTPDSDVGPHSGGVSDAMVTSDGTGSSDLELSKQRRSTAAVTDGAATAAVDDGSTVGGGAAAADDDVTGESHSTAARKRPLGRLTAVIGRRGGQRPTARVLAARCAVALLLVAGAASTLYFYLQDRDKEAVLAAQEQARLAACEYAPVLANYDAKNLDPYFRAVLDGATGDWRQQFEATSQELREVLAQGQVVSAASDVQCAIKSGDETSAEAIVVIGQTITSLGTQGKPAPGQLSMVMRMEKSGDRWLVNDMNAPLAPSPQP